MSSPLPISADAVQVAQTATEKCHASIETLWHDYRATRDEELRNRLVLHYSPLVKFVAGRLRAGMPASIDQDDLLSDGVIGLIDAVQRFEPDRGLKFDTFAVPRIRGAILDGLRALDWVPRSVRDKIRDARHAQADLEARLGRTPTPGEVAAELGVSIRELHHLEAKASPTSIADIEQFGLIDERAPLSLEAIEDQESRAAVVWAIKRLRERDQIIIAMYYFEALTLVEIGQALQVSESRISQLKTQAARRLRTQLSASEGSRSSINVSHPGTTTRPAPLPAAPMASPQRSGAVSVAAAASPRDAAPACAPPHNRRSSKGAAAMTIHHGAAVVVRRASIPNLIAAPHFAGLELQQLRAYRQRLSDEEHKVSYWRRLVHARIDILQAGAHTAGNLSINDLIRVLGDTGTGHNRTALISVRPTEAMPELPVLAEMWITEVDPHDDQAVDNAIERLREAETKLSHYRRMPHKHIDQATTELIVRYRADPSTAISALPQD